LSDVATEVIKELTDPVMIIVLGILGGALAEFLRWYKLRESPNLPDYLKSPRYWILTIIMIFVGGFVAWVYGELGPLNALLAINVGASAPLIISGLLKTAPQPPQPRQPPQPGIVARETEPKSKVREFLSWR
jgi:H+/Cl- antiporter ClcA